MHNEQSPGSEAARVNELEHQGELDRDTIAGLEHQGELDRDTIAGLEQQGELDRDTIAGLRDQAGLDQKVIEALLDQGELDRAQIENLQTALVSARWIGAAMGILMARHQLTQDAAFEALRQRSQHSHRKLRDIAEDVLYTGTLLA